MILFLAAGFLVYWISRAIILRSGDPDRIAETLECDRLLIEQAVRVVKNPVVGQQSLLG